MYMYDLSKRFPFHFISSSHPPSTTEFGRASCVFRPYLFPFISRLLTLRSAMDCILEHGAYIGRRLNRRLKQQFYL